MLRPLLVVTAILVGPTTALAQAGGSGRYVDVRIGYWGDDVCAVRADGVVYCWGRVPSTIQAVAKTRGAEPTPIPFAGAVTNLAEPGCVLGEGIGFKSRCGYCAIGADGAISCVVNGAPEPFAKELTVRSLTFSDAHACVLVDDGGIYCRGDVGFGQLGVGDVLMSAGRECSPVKCLLIFTRVFGSQTWKQVQAGYNFTCALADDGAAWCWGSGAGGRLGAKGGGGYSKPQPVVGDHKFTQIAVGDEHACGRTAEGRVLCWGRGKDGELGQDSLTDSRTPVQVSGSTLFASVHAGGRRTCGLTAVGAAWCWGAGKKGQLGNGELAERVPHPVAVTGGLTFSTLALARGGDTTCGLIADGAVACWGKNNSGQLGNGGKADSPEPVRASLP